MNLCVFALFLLHKCIEEIGFAHDCRSHPIATMAKDTPKKYENIAGSKIYLDRK